MVVGEYGQSWQMKVVERAFVLVVDGVYVPLYLKEEEEVLDRTSPYYAKPDFFASWLGSLACNSCLLMQFSLFCPSWPPCCAAARPHTFAFAVVFDIDTCVVDEAAPGRVRESDPWEGHTDLCVDP
jgi:hypothetical protein